MPSVPQRKRGGETRQPDVVARQAEAQQVTGVFETAAPDMLCASVS